MVLLSGGCCSLSGGRGCYSLASRLSLFTMCVDAVACINNIY